MRSEELGDNQELGIRNSNEFFVLLLIPNSAFLIPKLNMAFEFKKCDIEGLYEIQPKLFGDNRGYFLETYFEKDFFEAGLTMKFVQIVSNLVRNFIPEKSHKSIMLR